MTDNVFDTVTPVVEMCPVDDIRCATFNPVSRTAQRALTKLMGEIKRAGGVLVPLIVSEDGTLADGHRRLACARELGLKVVPVLRYPVPASQLFTILNSGILATKPKTWMEAVYQGFPLSDVPEAERRDISDLRRIAGKKTFDELARNGRSTWILTLARSVGDYVGRTDDKYIGRTIRWLERQGQQFATRRAMAEKCPPEVLTGAIDGNRPIRQYWGVG